MGCKDKISFLLRMKKNKNSLSSKKSLYLNCKQQLFSLKFLMKKMRKKYPFKSHSLLFSHLWANKAKHKK